MTNFINPVAQTVLPEAGKKLFSEIKMELFENGRATEGVSQVCNAMAAKSGTSIKQAGLDMVTRQMDSEVSKLSSCVTKSIGSLAPDVISDFAGDAAGDGISQITSASGDVVNGFFSDRYTIPTSLSDLPNPSELVSEGWSVATNPEVYSNLANTAIDGVLKKIPVPNVVKNMVAAKNKALQKTITETVSITQVETTSSVPTSHRMATTQAVPPPQSPIGSFGTIAFQVSRENTITPEKFSVSRPARFAEHAILHAAPKGQHLGIGLRDISITIKLMHPFCKKPAARIAELEAMQESEQAYPLVLGGRNYGNYALLNLDVTVNKFGYGGAIQSAEVQLKLKEYF